MKRRLLCLLLSIISFATMAASSQSNHILAKSLSNAFKNHKVASHSTQTQAMLTTYGGADVANQPLPTLRAIA